MRQAQVPLIRVFLSSPGDVAEERKLALEVIDQLPYDPLLRGKVSFEVVAWDKPGAGTPLLAKMTPQEAINQGLPKPSECDIVIVIFWARMGTPLPHPDYQKPNGEPYWSGTEYEFEDALRAARQLERPKVVVYRRVEPMLLNPAEPDFAKKYEQWQRVEAFFKSFIDPNTNAILQGYNTYEKPADFKRECETHLKVLVKSLVEQGSNRVEEEENHRLKVVQNIALAGLAPGLKRLHDIITLGFLLPYLRAPEQQPGNISGEMTVQKLSEPDPSSENPRHIPDRLKSPSRFEIDPLSEEWIESLREVNFIPRRGWSFPFRPLGSLDTYLNREDPYNTTVPYCLDGRKFHRIISEEAKLAQTELKSGLEKATYIAFSSDVLETAIKLLEDRYLRSLIELADWLERWIRIEDGLENAKYMQLSMIDDRRTSIEDYKAFMSLLRNLSDRIVGK